MDVHEDLPGQVSTKAWIPPWLRRPASHAASCWERLAALLVNHVVIAEPGVYSRFQGRSNATLVQNYPRSEEFGPVEENPYESRGPLLVYVGGITEERGLFEMLDAIELLPSSLGVQLKLAGSFRPRALIEAARRRAAWRKTEALGWLGREKVGALLGRARIGLVLLHPTPNYVDAQPTKLFEYMLAGLPVIASDFPRWRAIVEPAGCGYLVDPFSPRAIASAIASLLDHPSDAAAMGNRGRQRVLEEYLWESQGDRLVRVYDGLVKGGGTRFRTLPRPSL